MPNYQIRNSSNKTKFYLMLIYFSQYSYNFSVAKTSSKQYSAIFIYSLSLNNRATSSPDTPSDFGLLISKARHHMCNPPLRLTAPKNVSRSSKSRCVIILPYCSDSYLYVIKFFAGFILFIAERIIKYGASKPRPLNVMN